MVREHVMACLPANRIMLAFDSDSPSEARFLPYEPFILESGYIDGACLPGGWAKYQFPPFMADQGVAETIAYRMFLIWCL